MPASVMYRVECKQCGMSVFSPDGNTDALSCPCCPENHSHEGNANDCPGAGMNHVGVPCPESDPVYGCSVTPPGEECPGEHCGAGVDGCQVCRPCNVYFVGMATVS
jgi:hypothetical protein